MTKTAADLAPVAEAARDRLLECSVTLGEARKWADGDRGGTGLIGALFGGPLKYFKLHKANKQLEAAKQAMGALRAEIDEINSLPDPEIQLSKLAVAVDVLSDGVFDQFAEVHIANQVATALLEVNSVLDEVGLLCTRLRSSIAASESPPD